MQNENNFNQEKIIDKVIPLTGVRRIIGKRMKESLDKSPQATGSTRIDMTGLLLLKKSFEARDVKVTYTDLLIKIVSEALKIHPELNASLIDNKIIMYKSINIGIAVAANDLLFVPVIKNVQNKSIIEISKETKELIDKVKTGKIKPKDFSGGTFTLSNLGMHDVEVMTPIINIPEAAILSVGSIKKELVVEDDDAIRIKPLATFSITIDHTVIDGIHSIKFLETIRDIIANPKEIN